MRVANGLVLFWEGPFSNFSRSTFEYKGHSFFCSEQAFMWEKAVYFGDSEVAEYILYTCTDPMQCKRAGRRVAGYDDAAWSAVRYQFMLDVCRAKFAQSTEHRTALLEYGAKGIFVEASPYDKIWGIGWHEDEPKAEDPATWRGLNLLGNVLTEVYQEITAEGKPGIC